jgi:tetratricopeptide (TPR) repeat protein
MDLGDLEGAFAMNEEGRRFAERFGVEGWLRWIKAERIWESYFNGRWDEAVEQLNEFITQFVETRFWMEAPCRWLRGRIRLARGDEEGAREDVERALELARAAKDPQIMWSALAAGARTFCGTDPARADRLASELLSASKQQNLGISGSDSEWLVDLSVVIEPLGKQAEVLELLDRRKLDTPWSRAAVFYVSGDFSDAADVYREIGALPEEAYARLRAAERLVGEGRRAEADVELQHSLAFWRSVGAAAYVREGEALLAETG